MSTKKEIRAAYIEYGRMWKEFDEVYRKAALAAGLSDSAFEIFYGLYDLGEGRLQRDICSYSCASKQTINSSVHKLEREGYIRLEPAESGRGMRLYLTESGKSLVAKRVKPYADADMKAFTALSAEQREILIAAQHAYLEDLSTRFSAVSERIAATAKDGE